MARFRFASLIARHRMSFSRTLKRTDQLLRRWAEEPIGVAVPFLAFLAVWLPPQMPDMFAGMEVTWGSAYLWRPFLFALSAMVLGLSAWFWTRAALTAQRANAETDSMRLARSHAAGPAGAAAVSNPFLLHGDPEDDHVAWSHEWAPRLALLAACGITLLPPLFLLDGGQLFALEQSPTTLGLIGMELMSVGLVGLLFIFVIHRTRVGWLRAFQAPGWMMRYRFTRIIACAPYGWPFAVTSLASSLAALLCVVFRPDWLIGLDAPTTAIAALAFAVGPLVITLALFRGAITQVLHAMHWISHRGGRRAMFPGERYRVKRMSNALGAIAMFAWFLSPPWVVEKHPVPLSAERVIEPVGPGACPAQGGVGTSRLPCRPSLKVALQDWAASRRQGALSDQRLPVVIVAAEGGASRAAAWLLSSLRMLDHQTHGDTGRYLFAISGVSGGSLGAASYLRLASSHGDAQARIDWEHDEVRLALKALSTSDLLSASIWTYFLSDMIGSLIGPAWTASGVPDRNAALELAFDHLWRQGGFRLPDGVPSTLVGLHDTMAQRRLGMASLAHLMLNGTDVTTGRRIVTSTIRTTADLDHFPDLGDFIRLTNRDVSLATAVTNSARFPFVSPAGRFSSVTEGRDYQIIDGGYFENYGARTAWELARAIEDLNAADPKLNVVPVIVIVSNDLDADQPPRLHRGQCRTQLGDIRADGSQVTVRCDEPPGDQNCTEAPLAGAGFRASAGRQSLVPQSIAPLLGLASTRSSHGRDALNIVKRDFCRAPAGASDAPRARMIHVALARPERSRGESAPMNWVLNTDACRYMMNTAPWLDFNLAQARTLEATLASITGRAPAAAPGAPRPIDCDR